MSNAGQALGGIVGAVIGFYVGGPTGAAYGFEVGVGVSSLVFPTQLAAVTGPKISDLRTTTSVVGAPVPIVYGRMAVPGVVMWLGLMVEHSNTSEVGGKGGTSQDVTTFSYTQSIAIGLCEGPITSLGRIWENGTLVYDARPQQDGESDAAYANRVTASGTYAANLTLYLGDEEQEPDPTMEAVLGEVSAFRGLAYIVYHDRTLRNDQALRHPNFKFEVNTGSAYPTTLIYTSVGVTPWVKPPPSSGFVSLEVPIAIGGGGGGGSGGLGTVITERSGGTGGGGGGAAHTTVAIDADDLPDSVDVTVGHGGAGGAPVTGSVAAIGNEGFDGGASSFGAFCVAGGGQRGGAGFVNEYPAPPDHGGGGAGNLSDGGDGGTAGIFPAEAGGDSDYGGGGGGGGGSRGSLGPYVPGAGGTGYDIGGALRNPGGAAPADQSANGRDGETATDPDDETDSPDPFVAGGGGGGGSTSLFNGGHYGFGGGGGGGGGLFGAGGGGGGSGTHPFEATGGGGSGVQGFVKVTQNFASESSGALSVGQVVQDICRRVGMADADFDVEELFGKFITGYAITRPMPARSAIEPLRTVAFCDAVESQGVLHFPVRGASEVATLTSADLGVAVYGSQPPAAMTTRKIQDVDLPRVVRVHYIAESRDYEAGEQISPVRISTEAVNEMDVEIAVSIPDDQAAQVAEVVHADAWQSRWLHDTTLDRAWMALDPADAVVAPVDSRTARLRILSIDTAANGVLSVQLARDAARAYDSEAVANPPAVTPSPIAFLRATELLILDLPALREEDDDGGAYAVCIPDGVGTTWNGAVIYRSPDGASFTQIASVASAAIVGTLAQPLSGTPQADTFDEAGDIVVDIDNDASLENRTETAVLAGANTAAIGSDGRWQIVQFRDAELVSGGGNRWRLTGLLHGRRGTESLMNTALPGDRFVLVSGAGVIRLPLQVADIGAARFYKVVTIGAQYATGVDQEFDGSGEALETFSPTNVTGTRASVGGDLTIAWLRRDRLAQTLRDGVALEMSEATEAYEVDVFDAASPFTFVRTLASATESVVYTEAQQVADFGSPVPDSVTVRVYQLSATVGRGTPAEATV